jgi:hypothetical protein
MTKIEEYKKELNDHNYMRDSAYKAMNIGEFKDSSRDKHSLSISNGKWHESGESMGYLIGYSGFYGSSGCTYQCTPRLAEILKKVINRNMEKLVEEAILIPESMVEDKRLAAESEARSVLESIVK